MISAFKFIRYSLFSISLIFTSFSLLAQQFEVIRLNEGRPIIDKSMFSLAGAPADEGANINGPSAILIPDWIPKNKRPSPKAKYYLYFAHHKGLYIRMAWAENIEGPWLLHNTGKGVQQGHRGVLDLGDDKLMNIGNSLSISTHVASPDVHVDNKNKRITLYFHGPSLFLGEKTPFQRSFVSTSPWGLDFSQNIRPVILGSSYFRVFEHQDNLYAVSNGAKLYKAPSLEKPWIPNDNFNFSHSLWEKQPTKIFNKIDFQIPRHIHPKPRVRHVAVIKTNEQLQVFFTVRGDSPERIYLSTVELQDKNWTDWSLTPFEEVLRAEKNWEGTHIPPAPSKSGTASKFVNQLRDPCILSLDGDLYLFYTGGGENAIGLVRLEPTLQQPLPSQNPSKKPFKP
jgi:hypothetical protein